MMDEERRLRDWPWRNQPYGNGVLHALLLALAISLLFGCTAPPPVDACAVMRPLLPIDLTQAGWDALDAADPVGAARIDDVNEWFDVRCAK